MKITEQAEAELLEITKDVPPRQQHFLRSWLLTNEVAMSLAMCGVSQLDWEQWKQSSAFIRTYERVRRLRNRRRMFNLRKLLAATLKLVLEMTPEERAEYLKLVGGWQTKLGIDLDLIWLTNQIIEGEV